MSESNYKVLKGIIDDYIQHMEGVNDKRLAHAEREVNLVTKECNAFNCLRNNLRLMELEYAVPQNT